MDLHQENTASFFLNCAPFFNRLESLYSVIDDQYAQAAEYYGFKCSGCEENCCRTHFYHHTYIEYFYILKGFESIVPNVQKSAEEKARHVCKRTNKANQKNESILLMCPLNFNNRCVLYEHRPMICRMHGIPHELKRPLTPVSYGKGCCLFMEQCGDKNYFSFDRTSAYFEMAGLEKELKDKLELNGRFKKTVAEMLTR